MFKILGTYPPGSTGDVTATTVAFVHDQRLMATGPGDSVPESFLVPVAHLPQPIASTGGVGFWDVESGRPGPNWFPMRAVRQLTLPAELVRVPLSAGASDEIRALLTESGLELPFSVKNRGVHLEFTDGMVSIGLFLSFSEEKKRWLNPSAADHPLGMWRSTASLHPVTIRVGDRERRFVFGAIPEVETYLDLTPLPVLLKQFLDLYAWANKGERGRLEAIAQRLCQLNNSPLHEIHRHRLEGICRLACENGEKVEEWFNAIRTRPEFRELLLGWKEEVVTSQRPVWESEFSDLQKKVTDLREEKAQLTKQVSGLSEQAAHVREGALSLLATLRSDLPAVPTRVETVHRAEASGVLQLSDHQQIVKHLTANLEGLGLLAKDSMRTAREVIAAVSLGQATLFTGSFAASVADRVAESLTRCEWRCVEVPVGATDPTPFGSAFQTSPAAWTAVVIRGINRSDQEAYAPGLVELLKRRSLQTPGVSHRLVVIGVVASGPSAIPPTPELTALGPVLDTDSLGWAVPPRHVLCQPGQLAEGFTAPNGRSAARSELLEWLKPFDTSCSQQWRQNALAALSRLTGLGSAEKEAMSSVVTAWALPHVHATGVALPPAAQAGLLRLLEHKELPDHLKRYVPRWGEVA
jgi:hypothetical protein